MGHLILGAFWLAGNRKEGGTLSWAIFCESPDSEPPAKQAIHKSAPPAQLDEKKTLPSPAQIIETVPLDTAAQPIPSRPAPTLTRAQAALLASKKPRFLEFTQDNCLVCQVMAPWVAELKKNYVGQVEILEINIDRLKNKELGVFFNVRTVPTQIYLDRHAKVVAYHSGLATLEQMRRQITKISEPAPASSLP